MDTGVVLKGAGLIDRSGTGRIVVAGPESVAFLQRVLSQDVEAISAGKGAMALFLTPKGKLFSEMTLYHRGDHFLVSCPAETVAELAKKLSMYTLGAEADVTDATEVLALLSVHGPKAAEVLGGGDLPENRFDSTVVAVGGYEVTVCRVADLGVPGFELHFPASIAGEITTALRDAGAAPVSEETAEALRIEAGTPKHGPEMNEKLLPPEIPALATDAISYTKGCYVGQETIARIKTYGHVNRELRGLVADGDTPPAPGTTLLSEEKKVGEVTSSCLSPTHGVPIALAFVKRRHFEPGTVLTLEGGGEARVVLAGDWA
jgi:folate-binding protein YgfZ